MPVADQSRNRAAGALITLVAGLGITSWLVWPGADTAHVMGGYFATPDAAPNRCWIGAVTAPSATFSAFFPAYDGGVRLAVAKSCFYEDPRCTALGEADAGVWIDVDTGVVEDDAGDAGTPATPASFDLCATAPKILPDGVMYTHADEALRDYVAGEPVFEAWLAFHPDAPWRCACGSRTGILASACEVQDPDAGWRAAREDEMALAPGTWRGGCAAHSCGVWDQPYLPPACCATECAGLACGTGRCGNSCGSCAVGQCLGHQCVPDDAGTLDADLSPDACAVDDAGACLAGLDAARPFPVMP